MWSGRGVFISHIKDEAPVAEALKVYLRRCLGHDLSVFVSSDYDSIATGDEWYRAIVGGITEACAVIVLLSKYSVDQRWIAFESGLARGVDSRVLPLTIRRFAHGDVGLPLSQLHIRTLCDESALEGLIHAIADAAGMQICHMGDASEFVAQLARIEAILPVKSITLEPVIQNQAGNYQLLRFRLSNTGNRDVELIELEVWVPKFIIAPNWSPTEIPNVTSVEWRKLGEIEHLVMWEQPFNGALDFRYGKHRTIPQIVSPHWTPRFSDLLKIPIRTDLQTPERWSVQYKLVARGVYAEPGCTNLRDVPVLE